MALARLTSGAPHDPGCTGCPACNEDAAALMAMSAEEYCGVLRAASAAVQAGQSPVLRAARVLRTTKKEKPMPKSPNAVPPPPDMKTMIAELRATGAAPATKAAALRADSPPPPPSLRDAIVAHRAAGGVA